MKKIFMLMGLAAFLFTACNKSVAPDTVLTKFNELYPGIEKAEWVKTEEGTFEAKFEFEGASWEAEFNADGSWIESSKKITEAEMPVMGMEYLKIFYADMTPEFEFEKTPDAEVFSAEMMKDSVEVEVCFDIAGKVLKDESNVVLAKFMETNANAMDVRWSKMEDGTFNSEFVVDGMPWKSGYNADGSWICSASELPADQAPVEILTYLKKMKIFMPEIYRIKKTAEGVKYVVDGKIKDTPISFIFDETGKFVEQIDQVAK